MIIPFRPPTGQPPASSARGDSEARFSDELSAVISGWIDELDPPEPDAPRHRTAA